MLRITARERALKSAKVNVADVARKHAISVAHEPPERLRRSV